ncbi:poly-gamma-glutamate biosynthesis protein PgsC [Thermoflavimicrobium dichotomicum]|uniref:Poly-gamma-glutamate biosynthesis protein PgsC/CapC n=1 Tax=Thermoflavimicrobium dichotomicum TaxID=46223 RepID=A0A1I3JM21_9BACL|nr:poly-gamma-glutamate biosynthesis protein PgsC [Thermoflavimicrobium dichotomicum]SFI61190.1 poly-gamma-glutamate biosynthesis protein PgsC/CapC [Thermoflavimicrobium dichotomicum]
MFGSDLYISLIIGVVLSLLYAEKTGVMPAGLVVPGYMGLVFDQPIFIALVFLISFLTYFIVTKVVAKFTILYGRRKFAAMLTTGIALKLVFDLIIAYTFPLPFLPFETAEFRGIGIIVPGLIANTMQRQGLVPTVGSTLLLSGSTFLIMFVYHLF